MGRKSSSKAHGPVRPVTQAPPKNKGVNPLVWAVLVLAVLAVGFVLLRPGGTSDAAAGVASNSTTPAAGSSSSQLQASEEAVARAEALAALGPREQNSFPPIPYGGYTPARPVEITNLAYEFAAEHPEILSYVPCFCGCENAGHQGSHDCFVKQRDEEGNVIEWDEHGVACAVCVDVAHRSRQLYASGATVRDIRAAIEKEFSPVYPGQMPTPHPPAAHSH